MHCIDLVRHDAGLREGRRLQLSLGAVVMHKGVALEYFIGRVCCMEVCGLADASPNTRDSPYTY